MLTLLRRNTGRRDDERDLFVLGHPMRPVEGAQPIPGGPRGTAAVRLPDARVPWRLHAGCILGEEVPVRSRRRIADVIPPSVVEERLHHRQQSFPERSEGIR